MRPISRSLNLWLVLTALAGGALFACGEDAPTTEEDEDDEDDEDEATDGKKDAGGGKQDAGKDAGKLDASDGDGDDDSEATCANLETRECDDCTGEDCVETCIAGQWGACMPPIEIPTVTRRDGGISIGLGDAGIEIETMDCPADYVCGSKTTGGIGMIVSTFLGASFCAKEGDTTGVPPACTTQEDCVAAGLEGAMCQAIAGMSLCVQFCE